MMERELSDEEEDRENLISQNARPNAVVKSPDHRNHRNHRSSFQIDDDFRNRVSGAASKFNKRDFGGNGPLANRMRESELRALYLLRQQEIELLKMWNYTTLVDRSNFSLVNNSNLVNSNSGSDNAMLEDLKSRVFGQISMNKQIQGILLSAHESGLEIIRIRSCLIGEDARRWISYLCCLSKLESLQCLTEDDGRDEYLEGIIFPRSLKKLNIWASDDVEGEKILAKIGSLPLLHTLFFRGGFFKTREWETVEGQFPSLRSLTLSRALHLELDECGELEKWEMPEDSSSCFPLLKELSLAYFENLKEIPIEVGEIPTLKSIELICCSETAVLSAKRIAEEQEDLHGEGQGLHVQVICRTKEELQALQYLATPNFHVSALYKN